ncbi:MAG: PQQ-binding-like beta-propeller repeat protein [Isosphaeraceae bacterium]
MTRRSPLAWLLIPLMGMVAQAQTPFARSIIPSRSALGRIGLERHWSTAVPLRAGTERVLALSMAGHGINERQPGTVYDAPATPTGFVSLSELSPHDDFYKGSTLVFTSGGLKDQERLVTSYLGNTRAFKFAAPFPAAPVDGDAFEIRGYNEKIVGKVAHVPATGARFMSDAPLSTRDDYYLGSTLVFTSGEQTGAARAISGYDAASRTFEFANPFHDAPADQDTFAIRGGLIFAQTNRANLHVYDAETGQYLWAANLGAPTADARPIAVNSSMIFITNLKDLSALDRQTGRQVWKIRLEDVPSSVPAADEDRVAVGLVSGKLQGFATRETPIDPDHPERKQAGGFLWAWQTNARLTSRPVIADRLIAFGSQDGKLYVGVLHPSSLLFRYLTGGPITANLGTYGSRTLIVPSEDNVVYAVDLYTAETKWAFATGAPVKQEPLVCRGTTPDIRHEVFIVNVNGSMYSLDPENGESLWNQQVGDGKLLAISQTRVYLATAFNDLFVLNRANGAVVSTPRQTFELAGLDLREYALTVINNHNDRLYMATPSGSLLSLREAGQLVPYDIRDPKRPTFGVIPTTAPRTIPAVEPMPAAAEPADDNVVPAPEPEMPQ